MAIHAAGLMKTVGGYYRAFQTLCGLEVGKDQTGIGEPEQVTCKVCLKSVGWQSMLDSRVKAKAEYLADKLKDSNYEGYGID